MPGVTVMSCLNNLTRTLALEFADHGIRVNAIAPDITVTPGIRGNHSGPVDPSKWIAPTPAQSAEIARRLPLAREGVDTECGSVAVRSEAHTSELQSLMGMTYAGVSLKTTQNRCKTQTLFMY